MFRRKQKGTAAKRGSHTRKTWTMQVKHGSSTYNLDYSVELNVTAAMTIVEPVHVEIDLKQVTNKLMGYLPVNEQDNEALIELVHAAVLKTIPSRIIL